MDIIYFVLGFMTALVLISGVLSIRTLDREIAKYQRKKKKHKPKGTRELGSSYQAW